MIPRLPEIRCILLTGISILLISCATQLSDIPNKIPNCFPALPGDQNLISLVLESAAQPQRDLLTNLSKTSIVVAIFESGRGNYKQAMAPGSTRSLSAQDPIGRTLHPTVQVFMTCATFADSKAVQDLDQSLQPKPWP